MMFGQEMNTLTSLSKRNSDSRQNRYYNQFSQIQEDGVLQDVIHRTYKVITRMIACMLLLKACTNRENLVRGGPTVCFLVDESIQIPL